MILHRLLVERFAGLNPGALISTFGARITLIHGPNEAGKSTLLAAIEHALFQRHRTGGAEVEAAIVPRGAAVAPRVEIELETGGRRLRLRKQFVSKPSAELAEWRGERFEPIADGEAADDALRQRLDFAYAGRGLGGPELRGIAEILLVPQGRLRFGAALGERTREQLLPLMGGVLTTSGTHELLARVRKRWSELFTDKGRGEKKGSPLDVARREAAALSESALLLDQRLAEVHRIEQGLTPDPVRAAQLAQRRIEFERRRAAARHARDRARTLDQQLAAAGELEQAAIQSAEQAARSLGAVATNRLARTQAANAKAEAEVELKRHRDALAWSVKEIEQARAAESEVERQRQSLEVDEAQQRDGIELQRARVAIAQLDSRLTQDRELAVQQVAQEGRLAERARPRRDDVKRVRKLVDERADLARRLAAFELRVTLTAERDLELRAPEGPTAVATGATFELRGGDPLAFELAGIGRMVVRGPEVAERALLEQRQRALTIELDAAARPFATSDPEALEELAQERQAIEAELAQLAKARAERFVDDTARRAASEQRVREQAIAQRLIELHPQWSSAPPSEATLAAQRDALADRRRQLDLTLLAARTAHQRAIAQRESEREREAKSAQAQAVAQATLASIERELERLLADGLDDGARATAAEQAQRRLLDRRAATKALTDERERLGDADAEANAAEQALTDLDTQRATERDEQARLRGRLEQLQRDALWQQQGELEARRAANAEALARAELDAAATDLLRTRLDAAQQGQLELLVRPLANKVSRMLTPLLGAKSEVLFGERLLPEQLARGERAPIETERLSAGTQDQVALLTRIALGELWAAQHGRHALLLDDPLVNCDPGRRGKLLPILARAAESLQLIVFTCDPDAWFGLPADTVRISIDEARRACEARG